MNTTEETILEPMERPQSIWARGLFMIIFTVFFAIAETVLFVSAIVQFFWAVFSGAPHTGLRKFGFELSEWLRQVANYQTFVTEERPFPWAPWPGRS